tara:strand:- start:269 stop:721 length:453 start_codon:yes stop_codon:yes gene_type:complete
MDKLSDILKSMGIISGKIYTDKDRPPFQVNEGVDATKKLDVIKTILKSYKIKSKIKFTSGKNKAEYDVDRDTIVLRPKYKNMKDFLITILHEIDHAKEAYKQGKEKYKTDYEMEGQMAVDDGKDFHDDNYYEEKAEKFGRKEYRKWIKKV